jgi:hypothetical protein
MDRPRSWLTRLGVLTSRPAAFVIFALYAAAWLVCEKPGRPTPTMMGCGASGSLARRSGAAEPSPDRLAA